MLIFLEFLRKTPSCSELNSARYTLLRTLHPAVLVAFNGVMQVFRAWLAKVMKPKLSKKKKKFDAQVFLDTAGIARKVVQYRRVRRYSARASSNTTAKSRLINRCGRWCCMTKAAEAVI
jgi:hypothetical protein